MIEHNSNNVLTYLYASLTDIQSAIRVVDTKGAVVIGVLVFPITNLGKIYLNFSRLYEVADCGQNQWLLWLLIGLFYITWLLAFIAGLRSVMAINDPSKHVLRSHTLSGTYYCGGFYDLKSIDAFYNRDVKSKYDLERYIRKLPSSIDQIRDELAFEQMKLAYIRDMKLIKLKLAYTFTMLWLAIGFISRILYLYHCNR